ncbi:class I SAM-dependent methyltransferase [Neorhodopirellula pilleata]|uniref:Methyltransferase domain protein n=1 Tax=Neorhodopirellula pilleata TaxID=2714738 RepID=A0A5C6AHB6_9BACT|nr:class I SAM-dependent methyltransferase [Neorhodopirellula pilleata]TWT98837.1 Methyltransferase domain protein [Neorhodopirellula pilleata]
MKPTIDWYDRPQYFDMVFRDETAAEVRFFGEAFERFVDGPVERLYEPGCGSGRLVAALAAKGYQVVGLDNNESMLAYLSKRLKRRTASVKSATSARRKTPELHGCELINGDMTRHVCRPVVDAAFCTFNTFRHLLDEESALEHLRCVAESLRTGGIYILGFHCIPLDADPECTERWTATHGGTKVSVTLKVVGFERRQRRETLRVSIKATKRDGRVERVRSEFPLRLYTPKQAKALLARVDDVWELAGVYDFDYDLSEPRKIDEDLTDAVFILRKR